MENKDFTSFVQEAGLIWGPSPEIYGGLAGFYTYGPLGKLLKNNVEAQVRKIFNKEGLREIEGPTILPNAVWKASGHLDTFQDRVIKCSKCEAAFRPDKLIEENFDVSADSFSDKELLDFIKKKKIVCPVCKGEFVFEISKSNLMMGTTVAGNLASLRPETATGTYLPYVRYYNYFRKKFPFGVFQIGKVYRNEISPRQSVLRGREFTQAEGQIFVDPLEKNNWDRFDLVKETFLPLWTEKEQKKNEKVNKISLDEAFSKKYFKSKAYGWCIWLAYTQFKNFGIAEDKIRIRQHQSDEKAFYADDAWDIELNLNNYGWVEVCGIHDRTDYDLKQHSKFSGISLTAKRDDGTEFYPHVLEIAFGTDRPTYALMDLFYEKKDEEEGKTSFNIPYHIAPIQVSVFPLVKKNELQNMGVKIKKELEKEFIVEYDVSGSIGKRYLRSSTAGIPFAITVDFDSLKDNAVTIRDRNTSKQKRIKINLLSKVLKKLLNQEINFLEI